MMRGSVWVPDWPVASVIMAGRALLEEPVAIYANRVVAVNGVAYAEGVREGMKRRQAQSVASGLHLIRQDPDLEVASFERVVRVCEEHIAYLSVLEPGLITFLARGPVGAAGSVRALSENLVGDIALHTGLEAHVGFGDGLLTSILAARTDAHVRHAPPFLDAHPVGAILHGAATARSREQMRAFVGAMENLGVLTIGDLRRLDRAALLTRFEVAGRVLSLIDGGEPERDGASYGVQELVVEREADPPLANLDQAAFLARQMGEELAEALTLRGVIARELTICTRSSVERRRAWSLDAASAKDISDRVRWQLSAWMSEEQHGISRISIAASAILPAGRAQGALWGSDRASADAAARAVSRIQSLLGEDSVVAPEHVGGRHPLEAHQMRLWEQAPSDTLRADPWPGRLPEPWPSFVKAAPEKIAVLDARGHDCALTALGTFSCAHGCAHPRPAALVAGGAPERLVTAAGPWLQATGWWVPTSEQRKAWMEFADLRGRGYLAYREGGQWWLAGVYE
ncbi:DNA polymerase Y family protein [Trueperella bernardiae]|uniref:DNA polymerase Y family protein n=1 Tax=Trueperella bernardiae TaxID=59561 RepID=UPI002043FFAA|nr:hypothetical protein [Trueperella bernardiae]MCM3906670.1 hypothetical protein [Trueperella bernardiae]